MPEHVNAITWDESGKKFYESGVDHGVLYVMSSNTYPKGVAWNGLTAVTESPSGAEPSDFYADNIKYASMRSAEDFGGTIEAYTYPDEYKQCIGEADLVTGAVISQQERKVFGFCYRTKVGNDTDGDDHAYKLHIVYGATASVSERAYNTINDSPELITFSWEFTTTPVNVTGFKPTSLIVIDSRTANASALAALEAKLYGTAAVEAHAAVYTQVAADAAFDGTKTYYTKDGTTYTEATGLASFANGTTYYLLTSPAVEASAAVDGYLPLPDEVKSTLTV